MIDEKMLNKIYLDNQEIVEEKINKEYFKRIKEIPIENPERENIKLGIISELYYKEGFKDGMKFYLKNNCWKSLQNKD